MVFVSWSHKYRSLQECCQSVVFYAAHTNWFPMEQVHTEVRIRGIVQGVFFRKCTRDEALKLGVNGTVENMPDGSVLMHAQGKLESVQKLVEWCRTGPPKATVTAVDAKTVPISDFTGFKVLR